MKAKAEYSKINKKYLILIPLVISGSVHLINPVGFPDISFDEGIYMRRALDLLDTGNPQEGYLYDHPYFGQIILAGVLHITNFQNFEHSTDPESLRNLYLIPRIFMGLLSTVSTVLVFLIGREKFGDDVGLLSSVLFAVMPFGWIFNRILLDSILLPFLLGSIFFGILFSKPTGRMWFLPVSGILLGLAIFTKITAFVFIPLVIWIIFQKRGKFQDLFIWIIPVLLIPLLWPANSLFLDQFDLWINSIFWQAQRTDSFVDIIAEFLVIDPVLFVIGIGGTFYAVIKKNKFVLFWIIPFILFLSMVGYKQYFHWIPIIPILCIGASIWLLDIPKNIKTLNSTKTHFFIIFTILVFGFSSTVLLIPIDITYHQFEAISYLLENSDENDTILASPTYSWILYDVFEMKNVPKDYAEVLFFPIETNSVIVIADFHFMIDQNRGEKIQKVYTTTHSVKEFRGVLEEYNSLIYPYTSLRMNMDASSIDIRKGEWSLE